MPFSASKNKNSKSICYLLSAGIAEYITQLWLQQKLFVINYIAMNKNAAKKSPSVTLGEGSLYLPGPP